MLFLIFSSVLLVSVENCSSIRCMFCVHQSAQRRQHIVLHSTGVLKNRTINQSSTQFARLKFTVIVEIVYHLTNIMFSQDIKTICLHIHFCFSLFINKQTASQKLTPLTYSSTLLSTECNMSKII